MSLLTRGTHVLVRRGTTSAQMPFADIELRGTETTLRQIETRLENALNTTMAPVSVASVRVHRLSPLRYSVLQGPRGSTPPRNWWDWLAGL